MAETKVEETKEATASQKPKNPKTPRKPKTNDSQVHASRKKKPAMEAAGNKHASFLDTGCRENGCETNATTGGYCRLHYIKNWKRIKRKEVILQEGKLEQYIRELVSKYPEKYLEAIRIDLLTQTEFHKIVEDLDLDESIDDFEAESTEAGDSIIDSIRREFEEDPDAF